MKNVKNLLTRAWIAYAKGNPFMTDAEFDALASSYGFDSITEGEPEKKAKHAHRMYSLQKVFDDDPSPLENDLNVIQTPKLDGAAISLYYGEDGVLVHGITRGDGIEGEDITDKVYLLPNVPKQIELRYVQISGEIVVPKDTENARNYASGALHLKSATEFKQRAKYMKFIAYAITPYINTTYNDDLNLLITQGFATVYDNGLNDYRQDGTVFRLNDNKAYENAGYTAKHPRGAYARKQSSDVAIKETVLQEVIWQVGRSGKITPVAIFDEIVIDDAKINRATLNNVGFIEEMQLEIGDVILVTRSGGIIPKVLGKV